MKYLLFKDPSKDYGVKFSVTTVGVLQQGFGEFDDGVASKLLREVEGSVVEITTEQFQSLKKKLTDEPVSFKRPQTMQMNPEQNPNAHYAEAASHTVQSEPVEAEVIEINDVKLDNPLEE
jgi:hypothetical protein